MNENTTGIGPNHLGPVHLHASRAFKCYTLGL